MSELKTLKSLFNDRIYVIPDYQRGYAWGRQQLADFWEDLVNIKDTPHYMGVLSIKETEPENENKVYEVIDGQQRLTTCIILIQSIIEFAENNFKRDDNTIYFSEYGLTIEDIKKAFLYRTNRETNQRKYKFKYCCDKASELCFNHKILNELNSSELQQNLYTNKLEGAKSYFTKQLKDLYGEDKNENNIKTILKNLINKLKFNEFIIEKDFDTNVAFESMNNRGKKLSTLELLKNRLLFLSAILSDNKEDINYTKKLIVETWAEIYKQLGKNNDNDNELLDDDFLKTHWIFYWGYTRQKGNDYEEFLLKKKFIRKNVYKSLKSSDFSMKSDYEEDDDDDDDNSRNQKENESLTLSTINDYAASLKGSVSCWVDSFSPRHSQICGNDPDIVEYLNKFNRIKAGAHFRPLITVVLQKCKDKIYTKELLLKLLKTIERFVFIVFALNHSRRNSYDAKFYNYSKDLYHGDNSVTVEKIIDDMENILKEEYFKENGEIKEEFVKYIQKQFKDRNGKGYYGWDKIRYFLYEYEVKLTEDKKRNIRLKSDILLKDKDNTIEHIYPQKDDDKYWVDRFGSFNDEQKKRYKNAIGNLLLLSQPINSALQNDSFDKKKEKKMSADGKITERTGYKEGSYSEQEVAEKPEWTQKEIIERSEKLINFMEEHWQIKFAQKYKEYLINPTLSDKIKFLL